jgi:hypothetical protein
LQTADGSKENLNMRNQIVKISLLSRLLGGLPILAQQKLSHPNEGGTNLRSRLKASFLILLLGLTAPVCSFATEHYCIATAGGFGHGGTTFIGVNFAVPAEGICTPWSGFTKTASTVVLMTSGTGCLSSDGKVLTVSVSSADPEFLGAGSLGSDYIQLSRSESKGSFTGGTDKGEFGGSAEPVTCTSSLENLPSSHD